MAPLIQFPIDLTRLVSVLSDVRDQLAGIRAALEAMNPPIPLLDPPKPAGLSDLRRTDPDTVSKIKTELELFAENSNVVLDSDAFIKAIIGYESDVAAAYGEEAINELPWNKAAGGPIFDGYANNHRRKAVAEEASREPRPYAESAPGSAQAQRE